MPLAYGKERETRCAREICRTIKYFSILKLMWYYVHIRLGKSAAKIRHYNRRAITTYDYLIVKMLK